MTLHWLVGAAIVVILDGWLLYYWFFRMHRRGIVVVTVLFLLDIWFSVTWEAFSLVAMLPAKYMYPLAGVFLLLVVFLFLLITQQRQGRFLLSNAFLRIRLPFALEREDLLIVVYGLCITTIGLVFAFPLAAFVLLLERLHLY